MLTYRFYVLEGGHVREPPQIYECPDDEAAAETAAQLSNRRMIEVWDRSRLVVRLEATDEDRLRVRNQ